MINIYIMVLKPKEVLKRLHYSKNLPDIIEEYSSVSGDQKESLLEFIENSSDDEFEDMVDSLRSALQKRKRQNNKQQYIYVSDLGLIYDQNKFIYRFKEEWEGGRRRRRRRSRRKSKRKSTKKRRRKRRKSTKKKRRRRRRK